MTLRYGLTTAHSRIPVYVMTLLDSLSFRAFLFGILSAAALPLGALTAAFWVPKQKVVAALMAFGGGALLAALTIDLVGDALEKGHVVPLCLGCIAGGALFTLLNQAVNERGGYLRKAATTVSHLKKKKIQSYKKLFSQLAKVPVLHRLPPEEMHVLIPYISCRSYARGSCIIRQGDPGDSLFIVESGRVDILDESHGRKKLKELSAHDVIGEIALLTGRPRSATAVAVTDTKVWVIHREDFEKILPHSPRFAGEIKQLATGRISDLASKKSIPRDEADKWADEAIRHVDGKSVVPTEIDIKEAASSHEAAPVAIWLGILLDGIPESLVIGASMIHTTLSLSLIAGLFLSNFPEALSSSVGMRQQRYPQGIILGMWSALMLFTGIGAYAGNLFFVNAPVVLFVAIEGVAAGAMLTMIAETMLPEAYYKGGGITGLSTLMGFLAAIVIKTFE